MNSVALDIFINNDLSLYVSFLNLSKPDKPDKLGTAGWILFRRVNAPNYSNELDGHMVTSMIAKEWKKLTKDDKLKWRDSAENPDQCGNRWVKFA